MGIFITAKIQYKSAIIRWYFEAEIMAVRDMAHGGGLNANRFISDCVAQGQWLLLLHCEPDDCWLSLLSEAKFDGLFLNEQLFL